MSVLTGLVEAIEDMVRRHESERVRLRAALRDSEMELAAARVAAREADELRAALVAIRLHAVEHTAHYSGLGDLREALRHIEGHAAEVLDLDRAAGESKHTIKEEHRGVPAGSSY